MRFLQCIVMVLIACSLNSCGLINTAYNNAPSLVSWWLDDYLDFSPAQTALLNPALITLHDWHRQTQLPLYVSLLQDLQGTLAQAQFTPEVACDKLDQMKSGFTTLQLQSVPIMLTMAPLITEQQHTYLQKKLAERTQKWKKEWWPASTEDQIEVRVEKAVDIAEKVYGGLSDAQRSMLALGIKNSGIQPELTYREILRRNQDIQQAIRALQDTTLSTMQKSQHIQEGFARFQHSPDPVYAAYAEQNKQRTCELIAEFHQHTNTQQKQHAQNWLAGYIGQFSALAITKTAAKS
ncbi:MAG TPA: DUF6279 family lipoprotein [Methylophilus sp.]